MRSAWLGLVVAAVLIATAPLTTFPLSAGSLALGVFVTLVGLIRFGERKGL